MDFIEHSEVNFDRMNIIFDNEYRIDERREHGWSLIEHSEVNFDKMNIIFDNEYKIDERRKHG